MSLPREVARVNENGPDERQLAEARCIGLHAKGTTMPAQRTPVPACHSSGQQPDTSTVPSASSRHLSLVSTPQTPTLEGHPTETPADSGPALDLPTTSDSCSTRTLCVQLEELRTALQSAGHVDDQVIDVLTGVIAGLSIATKTHLKAVD